MTARAPVLGSIIRWAMRPILHQVNSTLGGAGVAARDDQSRRVSRYSARSITIAFFAAVPMTHGYSERSEFSLRLVLALFLPRDGEAYNRDFAENGPPLNAT